MCTALVKGIPKIAFGGMVTAMDASRRGKKELKYSRDKNERHEPLWDGGRKKSLLRIPMVDLSYDYK